MINCSIVLYNPDLKKIDNTIHCVLSCKLLNKLYLIDNSELNTFSKIIEQYGEKVEYIFNKKNYGFGKGHNIALNISKKDNINFHVIINPDVYFENGTIEELYKYMHNQKDIGLMMPKLVNPDFTTQFLPKLLPSPLSLILRIISKKINILNKFINNYELRHVDENHIYETPVISGCFVLLNLELLKNDFLFDENFFMYFEDWDLSRRVNMKYKTVYFPRVKVVHEYASGANKSIRLMFIYISSAILYFNKWGWIIDKNRSKKNIETLLQFK
jgi:GT2 family glycosyltransferase